MVYTCNSCNLAFEDATNQRDHMKGDWHRYNLKRRVAQLPPVDEESFNLKVSATSQESNDSEKSNKKAERRRKKEEILEQKRKILETARRAMQQKQDAQLMSGMEELGLEVSDPIFIQEQPKDTLSSEELEEQLYKEKEKNRVDIPPSTCLFCHPKERADFATVDESIEHMFQKHGLYVPEIKYLVDKEGLIRYLGEKIGFGNICLCCNYQGRNVEAVREHMKVKRHMRIPYESEDEKLEISEFYDFSSTYNDFFKAEDLIGENDGDDWEDISGEEGEYNSDEDLPEKDAGAIVQNGFELILPTGKVLGHRSLQRYFKQNLPPERELSEGQGTIVAAEDRHMLNVRDKKEFGTQKLAWRSEQYNAKFYEKKAAKNANNQMHYRDQLLQ